MFAKSWFSDRGLSGLYVLQCICFVAVLGTVFAFLAPVFLSPLNLVSILTASAVIGLLAFGETFVIASGSIDLSISSLMALSAVVAALAAQMFGLAPPAVLAIAVATGMLGGLLTGLLVNLTRAPSFIVTLGTLSIYRALAFIITGGIPIYGLSDSITAVSQSTVLGLSLPAVVMLVGGAVAFVLLTKTRFGKHALLLGDNPLAAEEMGILVDRLRLKIFLLAGAFAGFAGFVFMSRTNSGDPSAGQNYELIAITAVVLGGANLFGGRAAVIGTLAGVLCLGVLQNGLNLLAISTFYQTLFVGIVLITASFLRRLS